MCASHTTLTVRSSISNNQSDSGRNAEGEQTEQRAESPKESNGLLSSIWNRGVESDLGGFRQVTFELAGHLPCAVVIKLPESVLSSSLKATSGNFTVNLCWLSPVQVVQKEAQDPHPTVVPLLLPSGSQFLTLIVPSIPSPTIRKA